MKRVWVVRPDPETGMVSREELVQALMDGEATCWVAGGTLSMVTYRQPTGVPGEMVTVAVGFEWKDRTDAKAQPEDPADALPFEHEPEPAAVPVPAEEPEATAEGLPAVPQDGIDEAELPEEDVSEIPVALR
jgi:hypothetical protein